MRARRLPCLLVFLCAASGICLADLWKFPPWPAFLLAAALAMLAFKRGIEEVWRADPLVAMMFAAAFSGLHQVNWHAHPSRLAADHLIAAGAARDFKALVTGEAAPAGKGRWGFDCRIVSVDGVRVDFPARAVARGQEPVPGDLLRLRASALAPRPAPNPGQINMAQHLARRGIFVELHARHPGDMERIGQPGLGWLADFARGSRERLKSILTRDLEFDPTVSAVIHGVVLGQTGELPRDLMENFQTAGALHIFSVSGLHVGMVGLIIWTVLGAAGLGPKARAVGALCAVWLYAVVTGGSIPAVRAAIMASSVAGSILLGREPSPLNSIAAAGALLLAADTNALFLAGFQLSFGAVFALALFAERLAKPLRTRLAPDPLIPLLLVPKWRRWVSEAAIWFANLFVVSFVAGLGTSLFSALHFSLLTPGGALANMVAVPLAFGTLAIGLLSIVLSFFAPPLSVLANNSNWLVTASLVQATSFFGSQPWAAIPGNPAAWTKSRTEIWALALEEGSATVVRTGRSIWLIGAGTKEEYERVIRPFLRWIGVSRLDGLVLPQGDARYYGGAERCVAELRPRRILQAAVHDRSPTRHRFNDWLEAGGIAWEEIAADDRLPLAPGVEIEALHPPRSLRTRMAGERALAIMLLANGERVLICAEPPFSTQSRLADLGPARVSARIAIIGQSRVDPIPNPRFIEAVNAEAWIWPGAPSDDPDEEAEAAAQLYPVVRFVPLRTGAVRIRLEPGSVRIDGHLSGPLFPAASSAP